VILDKLHPQAKIIMGNPHIVPLEMGLNNTFKGMLMLGFHAMAETEEALLSHTYSHDMKALYLNGVLIGEIGMEAAIAGMYEVPLIMISGDSKGIEEAERILEDLDKPETAVVKYAISEAGAICFSPSVTRDIIRRKAESAVKRINEFKPYQPKPSGNERNRYVVDLDFYKHEDREKALDRAKRAGKNNICQGKYSEAIVLEGNDLSSLWKGFIKIYQG
jgi:D-amino peptidase